MTNAPRRNLPESKNRMIAFLLSVFFLSLYFGNASGFFSSPWSIWILLFFSAIFSYTLWALIHECVHGNFSNSRAESHLAGRILCILFGTPYQVAKTAHLMHHKFNREEGERIEFIEPNGIPVSIQKFFYYLKLLQGTYFLEVAGGFLLSLPLSFSIPFAEKYFSRLPVQKAFFKQIQKPEIVRELRIDSFWILFLFGIAFLFSGPFFWVLVSVLILRGFIVSVLDHSYHYGKDIDDSYSSYNLGVPKVLSFLFLNFNYHRIHHFFPGCPWNRLPDQFAKTKDRMDLSLFRQTFRQFRGLLALPENSKTS
ncbi:fatty acid desaturase family protein [Leptospira adleri]|uniref:Stearoyl-CoA 9-desaturase n=1 Tax=Leptospira adleri TaxID=2023186 RepID=A0A2M9YIA3_9LEPT|nr:fatty acid desaturase [Leptospira adleri]PJZ51277.1 stearoyl-CoA 9-desaturase [Leptospira adleri]PJZ60097.1 stearoyl-CoA 9-desaturase [Leptospira adleri]